MITRTANPAHVTDYGGTLAQLTEQGRRGVLAAFARVPGCAVAPAPESSDFVAWSILNQDPDSGRPATAEANPFGAKLPEAERQRCEAAATAWLLLRDSTLWARLGETLRADGTLTPPQQLCLIDLSRLARARTRQDCRAIQAYSRVWPSRSRAHLADAIAGLACPAEACTFMSTYKPKGLVPPPPFGLAAEVLVTALRRVV